MDIEAFREYCLSLPGVTEDLKWKHDLVFSVGEKMFAVLVLEPAQPHSASFKCTPGRFAELTEREGVSPAPYLARYHWVAIEELHTLQEEDLRILLAESYRLVFARLPRKIRSRIPDSRFQIPNSRERN